MLVPDIYGDNPVPDEVYKLSGDIQPGNSGGPLLTTGGQVAGVIFAKTTSDAAAGFAIPMIDLRPVVTEAPELTNAVSSGQCIQQ